jgi:hypothetical protein
VVNDIDLSGQQKQALARMCEWYPREGKQIFLLEGPAGSGKTTLAKHIGKLLGGIAVVYVAYTGKAASVLRKKGCTNASTIHSTIYTPEIEFSCAASPPCAPPSDSPLLCTDFTGFGHCRHMREKPLGFVAQSRKQSRRCRSRRRR